MKRHSSDWDQKTPAEQCLWGAHSRLLAGEMLKVLGLQASWDDALAIETVLQSHQQSPVLPRHGHMVT